MNVPLLDLTGQYESIKSEIEPAMLELCRRQTFVLGPVVADFETNIALYCGCRYAVGVSSGTDALLCCLMAMDIGPGDEVIVPTFTFFGSAGAVARTGATPVFVDVDPATFNIDPAAVAAAVTPRTKAVMPVHLYGQMAPMNGILAVTKSRSIHVIEDACQSIGAKQADITPGQLSDAACLSFYPSKNLAAFGDAGLILTQNEKFDQTCRFLRMHGETQRYHHALIGGNFRLDALQALVLDIKLKRLDRWADARRSHAALYNRLLTDDVIKPKPLPGSFHVYNQYVIRAPRRDELKDHLQKKSIGSGIYYPIPLHLQPCFSHLGGRPGDCPVAEQLCAEVLALPVFPELTDAQIEFVARTVNEFYS
jgi:dTDP-4-amino-4,6-dideoxygalactose transaminase